LSTKQASSLADWFADLPLNPVMIKELTVYERSDSVKPHSTAIGAALLLLPILACLAFGVYTPGAMRFGSRFIALAVLALLAFTSYGVMLPAATSLALERDRETLDTLTVSALDAGTLVRGKVAAAVIIGLMSKASVLPAAGLAFLIGGLPVSRLPLFLLTIAAVDLCYATIGVAVSSREHKAPRMAQNFIRPPTQAQLAFQRSIGISVIGTLGIFYLILLFMPNRGQHGFTLISLIEHSRILGVLHPMLTLVVWGPVRIFGVELPLWLLTILFHLLLAAPFYALAVERNRRGLERSSILPRFLLFPLLSLLAVLLIGTLAKIGTRPLILTTLVAAGATVVLTVFSVDYFIDEESDGPLDRAAVLRGLADPRKALQSKVATAPGFILCIALFASCGIATALALVSHIGDAGVLILQVSGSLIALGLGLSLFATFVAARRRRRFREVLLRVVDGSYEASEEGAKTGSPDIPRIYFVLMVILALSFFLPPLAWAIQKGAKSGLSLSPGLTELVTFIGGFSLSLNPLAGLLPLLTEPSVGGYAPLASPIRDLGFEPQLIQALNFGFFAALGLFSLLMFPVPLEGEEAVQEALARRRAGGQGELGEAPAILSKEG